MIFCSIDTETTGLDSDYCQVLSIGAVIEDTNKVLTLASMPQFHCIIYHERIEGQPYALNMNKDIIQEMATHGKPQLGQFITLSRGVILVNAEDVTMLFESWLKDNGIDPNSVTVAGKNFNSFDREFLSKVPDWDLKIKIHRRVLDPATSMTRTEDTVPPNLQTCLERVGIFKEIVHDAVEDAFDVVQVLRHIIK
jgi:oligoribonuclease (3'-5' exoribonuclease)